MIRLYWFEARHNFGDVLSPALVAALSGRRVVRTEDFRRCDLVAIGSVLHAVREPASFRGAVWGSGLIAPPAPPLRFPRARIAAVRGRLTRELLGLDDSVPLGDPGLLADRLVPPGNPRKRFKIGLVPHFVDQAHPALRAVAAKSGAITVIDICAGVDQVIARVRECETIFASAMHGLILADAMGIPNAWVRLSDRVLGGDFKFRDYYSVFGIDDPTPVAFGAADGVDSLLEKVGGYRRDGIERVRAGLLDSFPFKPGPWRSAVRGLAGLVDRR